MKIIALSDIHNRPIGGEKLESDIKDADLVVVAGDLTTFCGYKRAEMILSQIRALNNAVAAVAGNCDSGEVRNAIEDFNVSVSEKCISSSGLYIIGVNGVESSPMHGVFYHKLQSAFEYVPDGQPFIVLSHQPAAGSQLSDRGGFDGGSSGIRRFILEYKPLIAVSGHIHELQGTDKIGEKLIINPGPYVQGCYALITLNLQDKAVENVDFKEAD